MNLIPIIAAKELSRNKFEPLHNISGNWRTATTEHEIRGFRNHTHSIRLTEKIWAFVNHFLEVAKLI